MEKVNGLWLVMPLAKQTRAAWIWRICTGGLLFVALLNAFGSMLGLRGLPTAVDFVHVGDGLRLLCNRLFAASEGRQLYIYDKFAVDIAESAYAGAFGAAYALFAFGCAGLCTAVVWTRSRVMVAVVAMLTMGVQVYFGVFPAAVWNVVLFAALALLVLMAGKTTGRIHVAAIVAAVAIAVVCASSIALYPGANRTLYTTSETLRDLFDEKVESPAAAALRQLTEQRQAQKIEEERRAEGAGDADEAKDIRRETEEDFAGAEAGQVSPRPSWIALLTAVVLAVLLLFWVWHTWRKAAKRRAMLCAEDCAAAIQSMFALCMDCLAVCGLQVRNVVPAAYEETLAAMFSPAYAAQFGAAAALWRAAVYGGRVMSEVQRGRMQMFLDATMAETKKKGTWPMRVKLAFVRFNGGAGR